jgi:hypothetical protein
MRNATLVWSSRDYERTNILVLDHTDNATRFFHKVFAKVESKRLTISKHKYFYAPSDEYKSYIVRYKRVK